MRYLLSGEDAHVGLRSQHRSGLVLRKRTLRRVAFSNDAQDKKGRSADPTIVSCASTIANLKRPLVLGTIGETMSCFVPGNPAVGGMHNTPKANIAALIRAVVD